ncbi:MAG: hypothetical protein AAFQ44_07785, partial [Pseudomonadota bacterium]
MSEDRIGLAHEDGTAERSRVGEELMGRTQASGNGPTADAQNAGGVPFEQTATAGFGDSGRDASAFEERANAANKVRSPILMRAYPFVWLLLAVGAGTYLTTSVAWS